MIGEVGAFAWSFSRTAVITKIIKEIIVLILSEK